MNHQPLEGPIKPISPIANLAAAIRTFAPLGNENGKYRFGPRDAKVKCPDLDDMISISGEAVMEMHGFIGKYEKLKHDAATLAIQFNALRQDYTQLGDILTNFTNIQANDLEGISNAQAAARDYLLRLATSRKREEPSANGEHSEPPKPFTIVEDQPEPPASGEDSPAGA